MYEAIGFIGRLSIIAGFAATVLAMLAYLRSLRVPAALGVARTGFHGAVTLVLVASASLLILILKHQFQFEYIWTHSARDLPFGLLVSTFYAGQEGSFLLWTLMAAVIGVLLLSSAQKQGNEPEVMGVYSAILAFLLLLIMVKSPFARISYELLPAGVIPADGHGLNPVLQNFWMQIHPPILFLGFAAMAPPFALALAGLMQNRHQDWLRGALPWVGMGAMVLGLGLALGGFWAYETLGWGGWWGWDPVENSSLIPWLVSVALLHTMLVQRRTQGLVVTNFILAILVFVTVLYSTFLTRSGVLGSASVHSFGDPGRFAFTLLVLFMFVFIDIGIALLFVRFTRLGTRLWESGTARKRYLMLVLVFVVPSIPLFIAAVGSPTSSLRAAIAGAEGTSSALLTIVLVVTTVLIVAAFLVKLALAGYALSGRMHSGERYQSFSVLSREMFLGLGSAVVGVLTLIVLFGTSLPIVPQPVIDACNTMLGWINAVFGGSMALGNTVQPSFYDAMALPLAMLTAALTGAALLLHWHRSDGRDLMKKLIIPVGIALLVAVVLAIAGVTNPGMLLLAFCAAFSFAVSAQVGYRVARGNVAFLGGPIAHIGTACLLLGIIGSGYHSRTQHLQLRQDLPQAAFGQTFTYTRSEPFWNGQRWYFHVVIADSGGAVLDTVKTAMFDSDMDGTLQRIRTPGIAKSFARDFYIEPVAVQSPDPEGATVLDFTKGQAAAFEGYRVIFSRFTMGGDAGGMSFTRGGVFRVEKDGIPAQELTATQTTGPDGVTAPPVVTAAGDLELSVATLQQNTEDLSQSVLQMRLRNPTVTPSPESLRESLVVEVSVKPFISVVWLGIILMVIGFGLAALRRARDARADDGAAE